MDIDEIKKQCQQESLKLVQQDNKLKQLEPHLGSAFELEENSSGEFSIVHKIKIWMIFLSPKQKLKSILRYLLTKPVIGYFLLLLNAIRRLPTLQSMALAHQARLEEQEQEIKLLKASLSLLSKQDKGDQTISTTQHNERIESENTLDRLYVAFEDRFRGNKEDVTLQQSIYLPYIEKLSEDLVKAKGIESKSDLNCLDIGSGRGEWLELLKTNNYTKILGLDTNVEMVTQCKQASLNVMAFDGIDYLSLQENESLDLITAFHVVEHISFEQLIQLFDQAHRVLKPNGMIIFETPNPENLTVGAYTFYFDPTHKNPLPPLTLEFIAQQRGYQQVELLRQHPRQEAGEQTELTRQWFTSAVDYALIARKP